MKTRLLAVLLGHSGAAMAALVALVLGVLYISLAHARQPWYLMSLLRSTESGRLPLA